MFVINSNGTYAKLGSSIFHSSTANLDILARSEAEAYEIVQLLKPNVHDLVQGCVLNEGDSVLHKGGVVVYVSHCGRVFRAFTNLVLGSRKGIDTTRPLKVEYNGNSR